MDSFRLQLAVWNKVMARVTTMQKIKHNSSLFQNLWSPFEHLICFQFLVKCRCYLSIRNCVLWLLGPTNQILSGTEPFKFRCGKYASRLMDESYYTGHVDQFQNAVGRCITVITSCTTSCVFKWSILRCLFSKWQMPDLSLPLYLSLSRSVHSLYAPGLTKWKAGGIRNVLWWNSQIYYFR